MANKERGELSLAAGDTTYILRLTVNACCEMEEQSGKTLDQILDAATKGSLSAVRWLFWASLQDHHSDTVKTTKDVGAILESVGGVAGIGQKMQELMALNRDAGAPEVSAKASNPHDAEELIGVGSI